MPNNATIGSTLGFSTVFFDSAGAYVTNLTSATITITYPLSSNSLTLASCSIAMTASGGKWVAMWGTGVAAAGLSSWTVSAAGNAAPSSGNGTLRLKA
jgi:hypothetical protein